MKKPLSSAAAVATCGHTASGNGLTYLCNKIAGHTGWHQETVKLRDTTSRTNWGDDGLATHASLDDKRRRESR